MKVTYKIQFELGPKGSPRSPLGSRFSSIKNGKPQGKFTFCLVAFYIFMALLAGALRGDPQYLCNCRSIPKQINMTNNSFLHSLRFKVKTLGKGLSFWKQNGSEDVRFYKIRCGLTVPLVWSYQFLQ